MTIFELILVALRVIIGIQKDGILERFQGIKFTLKLLLPSCKFWTSNKIHPSKQHFQLENITYNFIPYLTKIHLGLYSKSKHVVKENLYLLISLSKGVELFKLLHFNLNCTKLVWFFFFCNSPMPEPSFRGTKTVVNIIHWKDKVKRLPPWQRPYDNTTILRTDRKIKGQYQMFKTIQDNIKSYVFFLQALPRFVYSFGQKAHRVCSSYHPGTRPENVDRCRINIDLQTKTKNRSTHLKETLNKSTPPKVFMTLASVPFFDEWCFVH